MIAATVAHIPTWVVVLLMGLIALGLSQSRPSTVTLRRSMALPPALLLVSLLGVNSSFGHPVGALLAWAMGVAAAVFTLRGRVDSAAVRFCRKSKRFELPGSWVPLMGMLGLFSLKFGVGMSLALHPELRDAPAFTVIASAACGVFSGIFLGRAMALWTLARQGLAQRG